MTCPMFLFNFYTFFSVLYKFQENLHPVFGLILCALRSLTFHFQGLLVVLNISEISLNGQFFFWFYFQMYMVLLLNCKGDCQHIFCSYCNFKMLLFFEFLNRCFVSITEFSDIFNISKTAQSKESEINSRFSAYNEHGMHVKPV